MVLRLDQGFRLAHHRVLLLACVEGFWEDDARFGDVEAGDVGEVAEFEDYGGFESVAELGDWRKGAAAGMVGDQEREVGGELQMARGRRM
jgi:hypothetical protein